MIPIRRHRWDVTPAQARAIQERLRSSVSLRMDLDARSFAKNGRLAAVDVAYDATSDTCFASLVLWDVASGAPIEQKAHALKSSFPYVPGLLSFREIPPLLPLLRTLRKSDFGLILCDGQGIAHPRRFGLASHLGVIFDVPSLGWAKSRLIGESTDPRQAQGSAARLMDNKEQIGWTFRSRARCRPTYLSPGHRVSVEGALALARILLGKHRLCEPARAAHSATRRAMLDYRSRHGI